MKIGKYIGALFITLLLATPSLVFATLLDDITLRLQPVSSLYGQPPLTGQDTRAWLIFRVGAVVQVFLGLLGLVMVILILYGGYLWMTARGEEAKITKAQDIIKGTVIGLILVLSAYAITVLITSGLNK